MAHNRVEWVPPEPRSGLIGAWDKFVGPGVTDTEQWLMLIPTVIAGLAAPVYAIYADLGWSTVQLLVAALVAFDLVGGVVTNATATAKRWYHRPEATFRDHVQFVAVHFLHPLLVGWLFWGGDWLYVAVVYGYLLLAAVLILKTPLYLQRPLAYTLYLLSLLLALYTLPQPPGLEWFLPIFYFKLLVSHLVTEAPFAPE
ncbi:MAG: hypothetical protein HND44_20485 [Chloroflexi bacterium]|nr:hypothetical protein [Ardenticatenaceae bacterium]MBL1130825.1 hypothetical protein [Chloroflexota bacterium]NOG36922.1 hypothetical protein [Chloroflexota bacterium]GIK57149.1 MAG: hypothetical protein BroJett015_28120 [Chloroflexota bacterium]